jgi:hypothetical protein
MHVEPTDSCPPVQPTVSKHRPACQQAKPLADFATTPSSASSHYQDCQRTVSRLASRCRQAAMRLLIAAHPVEWAGLLGLVRAGRQAATNSPTGVAAVPEPSARRLLGLPRVDAPSARAASLASSAASHYEPGLLRSTVLDPPGIPPGNPRGIPPAPDGGPRPSSLGRIAAGRCPFGGPVGRKTRGRLAPRRGSGAAAPSGALRAIDPSARPRSWRTFGPRRLRRHSDTARIATQGGGTA